LLEEKDFEMIENKLKSALNYEWLYYEFKKAVKENMDELVRDIAESLLFQYCMKTSMNTTKAAVK